MSKTSLYPGVLTGPSLLCEGSEFGYSGVGSLLRRSNRGLQYINALGSRSGLGGKLIHLVFYFISHNIGVHSSLSSIVTHKPLGISPKNNRMILDVFFQNLVGG